MERSRLDAEQLDERLHDAWVDLSAVEHDQGTVIVHGELEKPVDASQASSIGRFGFRLVIPGADDIEVVDSEGVGTVPIEQVEYDGSLNTLRLVGGIPGYIKVRTSQRQYELEVSDTPSQVRRFLRWRPV